MDVFTFAILLFSSLTGLLTLCSMIQLLLCQQIYVGKYIGQRSPGSKRQTQLSIMRRTGVSAVLTKQSTNTQHWPYSVSTSVRPLLQRHGWDVESIIVHDRQ